jgi:hypothetical protein
LKGGEVTFSSLTSKRGKRNEQNEVEEHAMYLLIGYENDPCIRIVCACLRNHGHKVYTIAEPLSGDTSLCWKFDTAHSQSSFRWCEEPAIVGSALQGVLLRGTGEATNPGGWDPADLAYVNVETRAALIAWLQSLACPVVNRLTADLWFRPRRPLVAWHTLFLSCGLPTLAIQMTNDLTTARQFADRWHGELIYAPLTSSVRYPVVMTQQWSELARLMEHLPVTLLEPYQGTACYATIVGRRVIWSDESGLTVAEREAVEAGLRQLAFVLQVDLVQVELLVGTHGPRCIDVNIFPQFAVHSPEEQMALGEGIVTLLTGSHEMEVGR